jgi:hypothetical protein
MVVGILAKVDMKELSESKATFVFGQMNETAGRPRKSSTEWFDHCRILS